MSAPKNRYELWQELTNEYGLVAEDLLDSIEELGLVIVPRSITPRSTMAFIEAAWPARSAIIACDADVESERRGLEAWIAASPFAPPAHKGET